MPDRALLAIVADRLDAHPPPDTAADLVLAAFQPDGAVDAVLRGEPGTAAAAAAPAATEPRAVHLTELTVEGFRGIGERTTLTLTPGPGLTLVVGRNGSGKSSFSEALEMLLLGTNQRWAGRPKVWGDGWRNLHHATTAITARFTVEGRAQPLTITRSWPPDVPVEQSQLAIDGKPATLDTVGWQQPLTSYPPLLSHHQLESVLDQPAHLYDELSAILGLGDIAAAAERLRQARLNLEHQTKTARTSLTQQLRPLLEQTDDERAQTVLHALAAKTWDIAAVQRVVSGTTIAGEDSILRRLRDLSATPVVQSQALQQAITDLRTAHQTLEKQRDTDAARALELAQLLEQALHVHTDDSTTCAVCGTTGVITYEWRLGALSRIEQLRTEAESAHAARHELRAAIARAKQLITHMPAQLHKNDDSPVDTAVLRAVWQLWADPPKDDDPLALAVHLDTQGPRLIAAVADVRNAARTELERREKSWLPAAQAVMQWLPLGIAAQHADADAKRLKAAEQWLRDAHDELRDERFQPIAGAVQENWTELRQDSNVTLGTLQLTGTGTRRQLKLDAYVDGTGTSALGVMSQGELNCLALSLFLPRASLPESPFHFVVIDDPVQAMDPAKVEGLARTLQRTANARQVIVLTHDTRLPEAVRYLGIPATIIEVVRREQSVVELRQVADPVRRYIEDALAVANATDLPPEAVRVVPGFCRMALEAAAAQVVTRRMLRDGRRFADVHAVLQRSRTLFAWLALALFDDDTRAGDVTAFLQREYPQAVNAVHECNRGAHTGLVRGALRDLTRDVETFSAALIARDAPRG